MSRVLYGLRHSAIFVPEYLENHIKLLLGDDCAIHTETLCQPLLLGVLEQIFMFFGIHKSDLWFIVKVVGQLNE